MNILTPESSLLKEIPVELLNKFPGINLLDLNFFSTPVPPRTIVVSDKPNPGQTVESFIASGTAHLVQFNKLFFLHDIATTAALIERPLTYFDSLGSAVLKQVTESITIPFNSPDHKDRLMSEAGQFIDGIANLSLSDSATVVLEELYMNALFDAPAEAQNWRLEHPYLRGENAKMSLHLSPAYLAISCFDPYGSLVPAHLLKRLEQVYLLGAGNVIQMRSERGAGIGCMLMFEQCAGLYLGIEKGKRTLVTVILPRNLSNKQRTEINKSLHIIQIDPQKGTYEQT